MEKNMLDQNLILTNVIQLSSNTSGKKTILYDAAKYIFCIAGCCVVSVATATTSHLPAASAIDPARVGQLIPDMAAQRSQETQDRFARGEILGKKEVMPKPATVADGLKFTVNQIILDGSTVYSAQDLAQYYRKYLGHKISIRTLQIIADAITARYRQDGYVLSRAVLPAQHVQNGIVHLTIVEGFVAEVYVEGDVKANGARQKIDNCAEKIKAMRPLQIKNLERYVLLLNDLPGLTVKTVLSPAPSKVGAADLTFIVEQQRLAADVIYDNRGSRYMGPQESFATVEADDVVAAADRAVLQSVATPMNNELRFLQLTYNRPLGDNGLKTNFFGSIAETNPGFILSDLDLIGRSQNWGVGLDYPLLRTRNKNFFVHGKFDWLDTNTDFSTATLFKDHIRSLRLGSSYDFVDSWRGFTAVNFEVSKGLKYWGASSLDAHTPLSRYHGRSDYNKVNADISRYQALGERYMLVMAINGQYGCNNKLLSAEEFSFGGAQFGRGYDSSEISGDSGTDGKLEFRVNTFPDWRLLQQIQYYTFYDAGVVWNMGDDYSQPKRESGTTVGGGLRSNFNAYFYGNLEAAKPLTRQADTQVLAGKDGNAWRFYFSLGFKL